MELKIIQETQQGELVDIYFSVTLIVNNDNELTVIDNSKVDWRDLVDCSTQIVEHIKLRR